jgi:hypothetical protein
VYGCHGGDDWDGEHTSFRPHGSFLGSDWFEEQIATVSKNIIDLCDEEVVCFLGDKNRLLKYYLDGRCFIRMK